MRKKNSNVRFIIEDGKQLIMCRDTYAYITQLKERLNDLERGNAKLKMELDTIKPVLAVGGLKPAVHSACGDCRFVVRSKWNNDVIGCNKDLVCGDFYPKED